MDSEFLDDVELDGGGPPPPPPPPDKPAGEDKSKGKDGRDAEIEDLRRQAREAQETARFWSEQAQARGGKKDEPAAKDDEDDDIQLDDDLVDAISSNDPKRVAKAFKGMGFVRQKDVDQRINGVRVSMTQEAALVRDFPGLEDEKSDMFAETSKQYGELIREDPSLKNKPSTLRTAAKLARAELSVAGGDTGRGGDRGGGDDRNERIRRQSGAARRANHSEGSNELSPLQRKIVANLREAGADIDEERYAKRANAGVRMSLRTAGARGK